MTQAQIDAALDKPTFIDCHRTIRGWLEYQHRLGRKAVRTPDAGHCAEIRYKNGNFFAMITLSEYNYFQSLEEKTNA